MSLFKRVSTTLFSRIDNLVGEIENHDALIEATIAEQRKKIAAAKVQQARIQGNARRIEQQIDQLQEDKQRWEQRALKEAQEDESRAMACMQRRQSVQEQILKLKQAQAEYQLTSEKMLKDIGRCEDEIKTLNQKHQLMRARQTSAEALNVFSQTGESPIEELETSFDRWEVKIIQDEMQGDRFDDSDVLEQSYLNEEKQQELQIELEKLIAQEKGHDSTI